MKYAAATLALTGCTWLAPLDDYDRGGAYAAEVVADRPLAYWRLAEATGTVAVDEAGGHAGTYHDVTLGDPGAVAGNTSARFVSNDSAVIVGNTLDLAGGTSFSLEAWAMPSEVDSTLRRIMTKRDDAAPVEGWSLTNSVKGLTLDAEHAGAFVGGIASRPLPAGEWSHVVVTYDGVTLVFFIDGNEDAHQVTTVAMSANQANLVLGSLSNASGNAWRGNLDELAIYDHALPAARVLAHYEAAK